MRLSRQPRQSGSRVLVTLTSWFRSAGLQTAGRGGKLHSQALHISVAPYPLVCHVAPSTGEHELIGGAWSPPDFAVVSSIDRKGICCRKQCLRHAAHLSGTAHSHRCLRIKCAISGHRLLQRCCRCFLLNGLITAGDQACKCSSASALMQDMSACGMLVTGYQDHDRTHALGSMLPLACVACM